MINYLLKINWNQNNACEVLLKRRVRQWLKENYK